MFCSGQLRKYDVHLTTQSYMDPQNLTLLFIVSGCSFEYYISMCTACAFLCINAACKPFKNSVVFYLFSVLEV